MVKVWASTSIICMYLEHATPLEKLLFLYFEPGCYNLFDLLGGVR